MMKGYDRARSSPGQRYKATSMELITWLRSQYKASGAKTSLFPAPSLRFYENPGFMLTPIEAFTHAKWVLPFLGIALSISRS